MSFRKKTYGVNFPFMDGSNESDFIKLTETPENEIKSSLIHLLLTKRGSRYYLPEFGTNLLQYVFEPLDEITLGKIEDEITDAVEQFIPNLTINAINIERIDEKNDSYEHTIKINIDYTINSRTFESNDTIILFL
jgi:phage baseplate assembly protein W